MAAPKIDRGRFFIGRLACLIVGHTVSLPSKPWGNMPMWICDRCWIGMPDTTDMHFRWPGDSE